MDAAIDAAPVWLTRIFPASTAASIGVHRRADGPQRQPAEWSSRVRHGGVSAMAVTHLRVHKKSRLTSVSRDFLMITGGEADHPTA
jgi:hypothetical protein